ncbi:MAG: hypothetical protein NTX63_00575 [Candidatus Peregrinibacteria bacterium]|nr:hypothetical protein [Candidatus Peregrinibacteria bacterium]
MKKIITSILILSTLTGCASVKNNSKNILPIDARSTVSFFQEKINEAQLGLQFSSDGKPSGYDGIWWISNDDKNIAISNVFVAKAEMAIPALEMTPDQEAVFEKSMSPVLGLMDSELLKNGFTKNLKNSSKSLSNTSFYDYIVAYEKGSTICTFTQNRDYYNPKDDESKWLTSLTFACSDDLKASYDAQLPYLQVFEKVLREPFTGEYAVTDIGKPYGDFTIVNFGGRRGGFYSIFKKSGATYKILYSGQEDPSCKIVDLNKIPKQIAPRCWLNNGLEERDVK